MCERQSFGRSCGLFKSRSGCRSWCAVTPPWQLTTNRMCRTSFVTLPTLYLRVQGSYRALIKVRTAGVKDRQKVLALQKCNKFPHNDGDVAHIWNRKSRGFLTSKALCKSELKSGRLRDKILRFLPDRRTSARLLEHSEGSGECPTHRRSLCIGQPTLIAHHLRYLRPDPLCFEHEHQYDRCERTFHGLLSWSCMI